MVKLKKIYPPERYEKFTDIKYLVEASAEKYGAKTLFKYFGPDGNQIHEMSYAEFGEACNSFGTALSAYGLLGKRLAILSESRPEWVVSYVVAIGGGGVVIPLDRELQVEQIKNFLILSETDTLVFSSAYEEAVLSMADSLDGIKYFISLDAPSGEIPRSVSNRLLFYSQLISVGHDMCAGGNDAYARAYKDIHEMSAIIFTSGTTGTSKGVMLSHSNILECIHASANMVNFGDKDTVLSVLPLHHTYETCCGILTPICIGATVCINNSLKYVLRNINLFKPTGMVLVPLFVSTIYKKICDEIRKKGKEKLVSRGISVTKAVRRSCLKTPKNSER